MTAALSWVCCSPARDPPLGRSKPIGRAPYHNDIGVLRPALPVRIKKFPPTRRQPSGPMAP